MLEGRQVAGHTDREGHTEDCPFTPFQSVKTNKIVK